MTCGFCRRVRSLFSRRQPRCEACEKAMRAVRQHERSTQNLTRAALDGIDWTVKAMGHGESDHDVRTLVEDMLATFDPSHRKAEDEGR